MAGAPCAPRLLHERVPVARGDQDAPTGRHLHLVEELGEPGQREVDSEHALHRARRVEERHRAREPGSPARVELVGLGPREVTVGRGQAEKGPAAGAVSVIFRPPEGHAEAVGKELVFLQADPLEALAHREARVDVELAVGGAPRPDEAIVAVAVAHPGQLGMRAQHAEHEGLHGVEVVGIEPPLRHDGGAQPRG
jgi:hypothetical protein